MKKFALFIFLSVFFFCAFSQDYLNGKLTDPQWGAREIFYDRTQNGITSNIFQTVYKVFEESKTQIYSITVTHDRQKGIILLAIKQTAGISKGTTITYDTEEHGLIFTNKGNTDTSFTKSIFYKYLLSFTDAVMDYPVIHAVKTDDGKIIELDPLNKIRLRKQAEIIKKLGPQLALSAKERPEKATAITESNSTNPFNDYLFQLRDSVYRMSYEFTQRISEMRNTMSAEISKQFGSRKFVSDERNYAGDKRRGTPDGAGLLIENGNVFQGNFIEGIFAGGLASVNNDLFEYCGEYSFDTMNGFGWLKYKSGSYLLGQFSNGVLQNGTSLWKDKNGEMYFGGFKTNLRNGYGELRNANGGMYCGEFKDGKLVKGYSREVDPFGYATYSRIESKGKVSVDAAAAEDFFSSVLSAEN